MVQDLYPKKVKKFMMKEGNKLKRSTLKAVKSSTLRKVTGNYEKGIKRGKPYEYDITGAASIRVYSNANHAHLIEEGHEIVLHGKGNRKRRKERNGTGQFTRAYHLFRRAANEFESVYETDSEKFALEIVEPLNRGWELLLH